MRYLGIVALLAISGCQPEPTELEEKGIELLTPRRQLIRLSVDLRGVHPTLEELAFIEQYPEAYEEFADRWLQDPRFTDRMLDIFNITFRTRTGETYFDPSEMGLGGLDEGVVADSLADEPLQMIAHVIENDLPYSEVITADYLMANPVTATAWGLDYPEDETGWRKANYIDGRPMSGVLSSTTMWLRYPSAGVNANRHRANMVSRIFLCDDYLSRPVSFSRSQIDALTSGDPNDVIRQSEVCQSCHSSLDPLAAHFFGFWWEIEGDAIDMTTYYPEDEEMWKDHAGASPGYYGRPTSSLQEMGVELAEDPRFVDCAVKTVFDGITHREGGDADWTELDAHRDAFVNSDMNLRQLVRSIVLSPEYRAGKISNADLGSRVNTTKMVSPDALAGIIEEKTGYKWTFQGRDGLRSNALGLRVLAGGTDSNFVTTPSRDPSVGIIFIQERLAQGAGWYVAQHDLVDRSEDEPAILLKYVSYEDKPETNRDAFVGQILYLYERTTGVPLRPDAAPEDYEPAEVQEMIDLWKQIYSVHSNPEAAWAGVISVVLRDPDVLFY